MPVVAVVHLMRSLMREKENVFEQLVVVEDDNGVVKGVGDVVENMLVVAVSTADVAVAVADGRSLGLDEDFVC